MVYLVVAATGLLFLVVTAIARPDSADWMRPALLTWLFLALILAIVWAFRRPGPFELRRIDALWAEDRLAALMLVKLLIATALILGFFLLLLILGSS